MNPVASQAAKIILSRLSWTTINESINMINVRLKTLAKVFGSDSITFKKQVAFMQKGVLKDYLGKSAAGNLKVDYMAIKKALTSGKLSVNEANEILTRLAGVKIEDNGEVVRTGSRVPTLGEIRKRGREKMEEMGMDPDTYNVDQFVRQLDEFSSEFQSEYQKTVREVGAAAMEEDPTVSWLWGDKRPHQGRLTYKEMADVMEKMQDLRMAAAMQEEEVENGEFPF